MRAPRQSSAAYAGAQAALGSVEQRRAPAANTPVAARVFSEARPALEKAAAARSKAAPARAAAADALAALAFVAGEEPDEVDAVLALLAALWQDGAPTPQAL